LSFIPLTSVRAAPAEVRGMKVRGMEISPGRPAPPLEKKNLTFPVIAARVSRLLLMKLLWPVAGAQTNNQAKI
jgi:hypothetical protein